MQRKLIGLLCGRRQDRAKTCDRAAVRTRQLLRDRKTKDERSDDASVREDRFLNESLNAEISRTIRIVVGAQRTGKLRKLYCLSSGERDGRGSFTAQIDRAQIGKIINAERRNARVNPRATPETARDATRRGPNQSPYLRL
jgi:hypothetical protein